MSSSSVIKSDMTHVAVLNFVPQRIILDVSQEALKYLEKKMEKKDDFRMNDSIRIQTGVNKIEARTLEDEVEINVLEKLKSVQEAAYQEAYLLGLNEGRREGYKNKLAEIDESIGKFEELIVGIIDLKKELLRQNESHLVQLAFHMASRLAHKEISIDPTIIIDVIRKAVELAQTEEEISIQVHPMQVSFLEDLKKEMGRSFDFIKKVHIEGAESLSLGGCIIDTNYGQIDARTEERVKRLWESLSEVLPRVKDKIGAA